MRFCFSSLTGTTGEYRQVLPRLTGACIAGPVLGLALYAVLRVCDGWRYMPVIFSGIFLLGIGSFSVWTFWFSEG